MNVLRKKLHVDILLHLKRAGVDYGKSISRALDAPLASVLAALEELEAAGLVERVGGRVLKRDKARMKTAHEVRKHHVYYRLSRTGELLLRCLRARGPAAYLEAMTGEEKKALVDACRGAGSAHQALVDMGLVDGDGTPTELGRSVASLLDPSCAGRR
jgi:predicted transcriptional regulator